MRLRTLTAGRDSRECALLPGRAEVQPPASRQALLHCREHQRPHFARLPASGGYRGYSIIARIRLGSARSSRIPCATQLVAKTTSLLRCSAGYCTYYYLLLRCLHRPAYRPATRLQLHEHSALNALRSPAVLLFVRPSSSVGPLLRCSSVCRLPMPGCLTVCHTALRRQVARVLLFGSGPGARHTGKRLAR